MNWFTFACLTAVLIVTPFQWGLYFEKDMYVWDAVLIGLFLVHLLWNWLRHEKSEILEKNKRYFIVFLLPLMYVLTIPFALNPDGNFDTIMRFTTYACFFMLVVWTKESNRIGKLFPYVFHILGFGFVVFSFAEALDLFKLEQSMVGCGGDRVCGPVRYPNTFAALLGVFWFYTLSVIVYRKRFDWKSIVLLFLMIGYGTMLLHTYSRGGYIFFGATFMIAFWLLLHRWKQFVVYALLAIVLSFGLFSILSIEPNTEAEVVPDRFKERVSDISAKTNTAVTRFDFYKQAISMSKDSPWTGFGGESWYVYYPEHDKDGGLNQTHNGYLDLLIEIGWIGLMVFAIVLAFLVYEVVKTRLVASDKAQGTGVILALSMLFGHALVDYDFSYGTVWLIMFWLMGIGCKGKMME